MIVKRNLVWDTKPWIDDNEFTYGVTSAADGPRLLVIGSLHGNEKCGYDASCKVINDIKKGAIEIVSGAVTFIPKCNPKAFALSRRFVDRDLNREMRIRKHPIVYEDYIGNLLIDVMREHDVLLDIHAFRPKGMPFVFLGPEDNDGDIEPFSLGDEELRFAASLGFGTCVFGWLSAYNKFVQQQHLLINRLSGAQLSVDRATMELGVGATETFRRLGGYAVTVECGNLSDPASADIAYMAIRNALSFLGISDGNVRTVPFDKTLKLSQVILKENEADRFAAPWKLFDEVEEGSVLAMRADGSIVRAAESGAVVFTYPNAQPGEAWLYFAHHHNRGRYL